MTQTNVSRTGNPKEIPTVILNVESNRPYVDREIPAANA